MMELLLLLLFGTAVKGGQTDETEQVVVDRHSNRRHSCGRSRFKAIVAFIMTEFVQAPFNERCCCCGCCGVVWCIVKVAMTVLSFR
jgi:hypothetical protein